MKQNILRNLLSNKIITVFDIPESPRKLANITGISLAAAKNIVNKAEHAR